MLARFYETIPKGEIRFIIRDPENKFWDFNRNYNFCNQNYDFAIFPEIGISRVLHKPIVLMGSISGLLSPLYYFFIRALVDILHS